MARIEGTLDKNLVYELTSQIPEGRVSTYGLLAEEAGRPGAARAVGRLMNANPTPIAVPCHRVVYSDGRVGGYSGGVKTKIRLLSLEGVFVIDGRIANFEEVIFRDFK
jgi:O-6-methylguanine DNA methyltransferase